LAPGAQLVCWRRLPLVALRILSNHGGIVRLARQVGKGRAMKVAMGYPMTAEEAFRFGLAQWLVPHAELTAQTAAIAARLVELSPLTPRLAKESLTAASTCRMSPMPLYRSLPVHGLVDDRGRQGELPGRARAAPPANPWRLNRPQSKVDPQHDPKRRDK
jgi:enoyl-CoA hydratase/isomerase-like protein